jgi:hypothetical protein
LKNSRGQGCAWDAKENEDLRIMVIGIAENMRLKAYAWKVEAILGGKPRWRFLPQQP